MGVLDKEAFSIFKLPRELEKHHSPEAFKKMEEGIVMLDIFLEGHHKECIDFVVKYAEQHVKFFFLAHLMLENETFTEVFDLFTSNLKSLFDKGKK